MRISGLLWYHQESNRGHKDFQSFALPTELWYRVFLFCVAKVGTFIGSCKFFDNYFSKKFHFFGHDTAEIAFTIYISTNYFISRKTNFFCYLLLLLLLLMKP